MFKSGNAGAVMKKAVIFFFSGTGNTWWAAETLAKELRSKGVDVRSISIEQVTPEEAGGLSAGCDAAGFAYPVYGSDLPQIMKDFIGGLPPAAGKTAFVFCTQWLWSGDGARAGAEMLQEKGYNVSWAEHFFMPNNVCVTVTNFLPYTNDRRKLDRRLAKTTPKIKRFAGYIFSGKPFLRGFNPAARFSGNIQRAPFRRMFDRLRDDIGTDITRCTACGDCVRLCPSGNLVLEEDKIKTRGTCILCVRCYCFCPSAAITYRNRPHKLSRGKPYRGPVERFDPRILQRK